MYCLRRGTFSAREKYPAEGKTANHTAANLHNNLSNNVSRHIEIKGCFLHANRV